MINKLKTNWKKFYPYLAVAFTCLTIGVMTGMGVTNFDSLKQIFVNIISGLVNNLPWLIIFWIMGSAISHSIKTSTEKIVKNIPVWLEQYEKIKMHQRVVDNAKVK